MYRSNHLLFPLLLISLSIIFSCQKENKDTSTFTIRPSERNIVQGDKNGILIIPENCFVDEAGNIIKEEIIVNFTETYSIKDIFEHDLETRSSEGLLVSDGMVNLEAVTLSGAAVQIAAGKAISFQKATSLKDTNRYKFFTQSNELWTNPKPASSYLTYWPIELHTPIYTYLKKPESVLKMDDFIFSKTLLADKKSYSGEDYNKTTFFSFLEGPGRYFSGHDPIIIPKSVLDKSYIASKEYEERFSALPPFDEYLISIHLTYLKHLGKPLWVADSLALEEVKKELAYYEKEENNSDNLSREMYQYAFKVLTTFKNQYKTTFSPERFSEKELETINKFYQKIAIDKYIQSYSIRKLGWHNIDYFYKSKDLQPTPLTITSNIPASKVRLIFKEVKTVLHAKEKDEKAYCLNENCQLSLPSIPAYIVALSEQDGTFFFAKKEIQVGQNEVETLELKPSSEAVITKALAEIEAGYSSQ